MPARLVILASGTGTTLQAVVEATTEPGFGATVVAAGTDRPGCLAMRRAERAGIETFARPLSDYPQRSAWDDALADVLAGYRPHLVLLAGFMRLLGPAVVDRFELINTHPSLLPAFPGGHAVRDALRYGVTLTGVTVHRVDHGLDSGPILAQQAVPVRPDDDEDSLRARIQEVEKPLFIATIRRLCQEYQ